MTKPGNALFVVNLRHLAPDGRKAGVELPNSQLNYIPAKQLRQVLIAVAELAPSVTYPVEPELRIAGPAGQFVVNVKAGRLHLVSWASSQKGGEMSVAQIYAAVTGEQADDAPRQARGGAGAPAKGGIRENLTLVALGIAIVAVNAFTIWFVTRPPRTLLPHYTLLAAEPAGRVLKDVAGSYETGSGSGDRRLEIDANGSVQRIKFGAGRTVKDRQTFSVQAADAGGKSALITSRKSMITIKDQLSVILYGDTYTRVPR